MILFLKFLLITNYIELQLERDKKFFHVKSPNFPPGISTRDYKNLRFSFAYWLPTWEKLKNWVTTRATIKSNSKYRNEWLTIHINMPVYYAYSYITHREIYAVRDIQEILGSYIYERDWIANNLIN